MSDKLISLVTEWNDQFDFKISVHLLKKPTQAFLVDALQCFLASIHIDYNKLKSKMDERQYKILLIKYFNHFFREVNFKNEITFGNLIVPDNKKNVGILNFLVNYNMFFKMVKDEVLEKANAKILAYENLLSKKSMLQVEQEELRIQSENKEKALQVYTTSITEYKQLLEELKAKSASWTRDTETASQRLYQLRDENIKLESSVEVLKPLVVTEEEINKLVKSTKDLTSNISKLDSDEKNVKANNERYKEELNQLTAEVEEFSKMTLENSVVNVVEKYSGEMKNFTETNNKIKEYRNKIENGVAQQEELTNNIKAMEIQLVKKKNDWNKLSEESQKKKMQLEREYKRHVLQNNELEKKLAMAELNVEDLRLYQDNVIAKGIEVIEYIRNT